MNLVVGHLHLPLEIKSKWPKFYPKVLLSESKLVSRYSAVTFMDDLSPTFYPTSQFETNPCYVGIVIIYSVLDCFPLTNNIK